MGLNTVGLKLLPLHSVSWGDFRGSVAIDGRRVPNGGSQTGTAFLVNDLNTSACRVGPRTAGLPPAFEPGHRQKKFYIFRHAAAKLNGFV